MKIIINVLLLVILLFLPYTIIASSKDVTYPFIPPHRTYSELVNDFSISQLLQILKDRGTECKGCRKKKELAKYIAEQAQYLPLLKDRSTLDLEELKKAREIAEKWNKEAADRREYDTVMELFRDKEDTKKNMISKEVLKNLQNKGIDTKFIKKINPWDTFPGYKEPKLEIPEEVRMQQMTEGELEDLELERQSSSSTANVQSANGSRNEDALEATDEKHTNWDEDENQQQKVSVLKEEL